MAFCSKCGSPLKDGAKFCTSCGEKIIEYTTFSEHEVFEDSGDNGRKEDQSKKEERRKEKKPRKKWKIILILILILILALAVAGGIFYLKSPVRQVMSALNNGEYEVAEETYNDKIAGNFIYSAMADIQVSNFIDYVVSGYENGNYTGEEALPVLNTITFFNDSDLSEYAAEKVRLLTTLIESEQLYEEAEELYEEGEYVDALELYSEISEESSYYESAQVRIDECREAYVADVLERTDSPSTQSEYKTCISLLEIANDIFPDEEEISERLSELTQEYLTLVKTEAMTGANDAIEQQNYEEVFDIVDEALKILGEDDELSTLRNSAQNAYESSISEQVEELVEEGDYDGALALLEDALDVLPESTVLSELYDTTVENQPVKLSDLPLSESGENFEIVTGQTVITDTIGNTYSSGNLFKFNSSIYGGDDDQGYAKYYLGGEYTSLVFTLAVSSEEEDYKNERYLTVYGDDDEILYYSKALTRTSTPETITIDVTGTDWIYIKAETVSRGVILLVADPVLYK